MVSQLSRVATGYLKYLKYSNILELILVLEKVLESMADAWNTWKSLI